MNARELLKEARAELAKAHDHLMELTAKLPMQYFGLVDGNIIQAEDCLISQLDAYLAAPSESAMEMVGRVRDGGINRCEESFDFDLSNSDAAALIEGLQRRVPRKMLEDLLDMCFDLGDEYFLKGGKEYAEQAVARILAKHGVEVD